MNTNRRTFLRQVAVGAGLAKVASASSAKSYSRIIGANSRISIGLMGCGRRGSFYAAVLKDKTKGMEVQYLCDVMKEKRENLAKVLHGSVDGDLTLVNDFRAMLDDPKVDAIFNATPDHWHAPGAWLAMQAGKHVYLEKPCSHNPREGELLLTFQQRTGRLVQMGNQQRSSRESIEIMSEIHRGVIGEVYKAVAFYSNGRGAVPKPYRAPVPEGLDWDLWQGPAPREEYTFNTWDYNWHWFGWKWGTAETGNNGTHELDIARWALQVKYPERVEVEAAKRHFKDDGWAMYDTMEATFRFPGGKVITWDGKSRNGHLTYGADRGTIIYGTEGSVFINREGYTLFNRAGKKVREAKTSGSGLGSVLGGGGNFTADHMANFLDVIRGKESRLNSPLDEGAVSQMLTHYANISYRINQPFGVNPENGHILNEAGMKLWGREYAKGWEPKL